MVGIHCKYVYFVDMEAKILKIHWFYKEKDLRHIGTRRTPYTYLVL